MKDNFICPYCETEQDSVTEDRVQRAYYNVHPGLSGMDYQLNDYDDVISQTFHCPNCDHKLADNEDQVLRLFGAEFFYVCRDQLTDLGLVTIDIMSFIDKDDALEYINNLDLKERDINVDENLRVLSSEEYIDVLAKEYKVSKTDDNLWIGRAENLKAFLNRIANL